MIPRYAPVRTGSPGGGGIGSSRPRGLALLMATLALLALVLGTGVVVRPLWWRLKADLYEHAPEHRAGAAGSASALQKTAAGADGDRPDMATAIKRMGDGGGGGGGVSKASAAVRMDNRAGVQPAAVAAAAAAKAKQREDEEGAAARAADGAADADADADTDADEAAADAAAAQPDKKKKPGVMDEAARAALRDRIARMSPEQLERAREQAREQQWDDEWWEQYQRVEKTKREKERAAQVEAERRTVAQFNLTMTAAAAQALAAPDGGYVFVTWANSHYMDFALSWAHHLRERGLGKHLVVGAMDDPVLYSLAKRRIPVFAMQSGECLRFENCGRVFLFFVFCFLFLFSSWLVLLGRDFWGRG